MTASDTDVVVIAGGAVFDKPAFLPVDKLLTPEDAMKDGARLGRRVVILGGDGVGLGVAVFLLKTGEHDITVVEETGKLGRDVSPFYLWQYVQLFKKKGAVIMLRSTVETVTDNQLNVVGKGGTKAVGFDHIVTAKRAAPGFWQVALKGLGKEICYIGDAKKPRRLLNAIHEGYRLGMEL